MREANLEPAQRELQAEAEEPPRDTAMDIVISCWRELETCRALGYGAVGAIPWTAIQTWAAVYDLDADATALLTRVVRKLDNDYLAGLAAKRRLDDNKE